LHVQAARKAVADKLKKERATLTAFEEELVELERAMGETTDGIAKTDEALVALEHDIGLLQKEHTSALNRLAELVKLNPWVKDEEA